MKKGLKLYLILILMLAAALLLTRAGWAVTYSSTGNPGDTVAGTLLQFKNHAEEISYKDDAGTQMVTVEASGGLSLTVTAEYGFSQDADPMLDYSVDPGDFVQHDFTTTLEGNATVEAWKWSAVFNEYAGASNWRVEKWVGASTQGATLSAGVIDISDSLSPLGGAAEVGWNIKVWVATEEANAPNSSYIVILSTFEVNQTPVGQYTGANKYTYGGTSEADDDATDTVSAPVLELTRTSTVDAPTAYTGGAHDAVPGAVITFTVTYSNTGASEAKKIALVDKIPDNTKLAHVNTTGSTTNVTITAAQQSANGWNCYYSLLDSPDKAWGEYTGWSPISPDDESPYSSTESFPGGGQLWTTGAATYEAKWIKFQKGTIPATEDAKSIMWGVTIR